MAGKYEPNLSFLQWKDLTVDDLWIFQTPLSVSTNYFPHILCSAATESTTRASQVSGKWAWWPCYSPAPGSQSCCPPALHPAGHQSLPGHILQPNPVSSTSVVSVEDLKAFSVSGELLYSKGTFLPELQCLSMSGNMRQLHRQLWTCIKLSPK